MITIRKSTETDFEEIEHPVKGCWVDIVNPSPAELSKLAADIKLPKEFTKLRLDSEAMPRVEKIDGGLLIVVRIPHMQSEAADIPYITQPLAVLLSKEWVVSLCREQHHLLKDLSADHRDDMSTTEPDHFMLHLLWAVANCYVRQMKDINARVDELEDQLQVSLQNREVLGLLRYQKSLVHFKTGLRTNGLIYERLQRGEVYDWEGEASELLDDVMTENQQALETVGIAGDILGNMMDAFASIISNNLNVVIKFLTSITIILIVPSLVAAFYGMNIPLPLEDNPYALPILIGVSALGSLAVAAYFKKKDWL